jgi:hypothetical protein
MMKQTSPRTSLLSACQLSAWSVSCYVRLYPKKCSIFYVVICNYHEYCYNFLSFFRYDEEAMKELRERLSLSKILVPNGVKRGVLRNQEQAVCADVDLKVEVQSPVNSSHGSLELPTLSRRMWMSVRYWRSGSIWQKCRLEGRKTRRHFCYSYK